MQRRKVNVVKSSLRQAEHSESSTPPTYYYYLLERKQSIIMNVQSSAPSFSENDGGGKSVTYSSTRGCPTQSHQSFRTVVMRGLAHDRGLFVPDTLPAVTAAELESWRHLSYADMAVEVMGKFVMDDEVPRDVLSDIVHRSCDAFRSADVTPLVKVDGHYILVSTILVGERERGGFLFFLV